MTIFIDSDYKCHVTNAGNMRKFDVSFFDGKCPAFVEGYRYIPVGEYRENSNGVKCSGINPWRNHALLNEFQTQYEAQIDAAKAAYAEGVNSV